MSSHQADADAIVTFLSDEAAVKQLHSADKAANLQHLRETAGIGTAHVDALFNYAKFQFECGNYGAAAELLYHYSNLGTDATKVLSSLWGRLAAQILTQSWDAALESLHRLRVAVDSEDLLHAPAAEQVGRRAWLLHWALFVYFNHESGRNGLVDLFFTDRYLNAAQTVAPHLLRYAAVAAVVNRRRRGALRDLARVVEQEAYEYSDPITEFVRRLFTDCDYEGAREALAEAIPVMEGDFFVAALAREFADASRLLVFESYCRVHERVDLGLLSEKLGLDASDAAAAAVAASAASTSGADEKTSEDASADAAEAWIVDLIRTARLRARVDSKARAVVIASALPSVQDQLIETVKGLTQRTQVLANAVGAGAPRP